MVWNQLFPSISSPAHFAQAGLVMTFDQLFKLLLSLGVLDIIEEMWGVDSDSMRLSLGAAVCQLASIASEQPYPLGLDYGNFSHRQRNGDGTTAAINDRQIGPDSDTPPFLTPQSGVISVIYVVCVMILENSGSMVLS